MKITYLTEDPASDYSKMVRSVETLSDLKKGVHEYKEIAGDAIKKVKSMTEEDFKRFKKDLPKFRKKMTEGVEEAVKEWGVIVLPMKMIISSLVAEQFHAPWGTAYIRCEELGWENVGKK